MRENIKKLFSLFLCLAMAIGLLPMAALAAVVPASTDGVGSYSYNADNGSWTAASTDTVVKDGFQLTKTATPVAGEENTFKINLKVVASQSTVEQTVEQPAAVTLVVDTSNSMGYCSECGQDYFSHHDVTATRVICTNKSCSNYGKDAQSRLDAAKAAALKFVNNYNSSANSAPRYISIVSFGTNATRVLNWVDLKSKQSSAKGTDILR